MYRIIENTKTKAFLLVGQESKTSTAAVHICRKIPSGDRYNRRNSTSGIHSFKPLRCYFKYMQTNFSNVFKSG